MTRRALAPGGTRPPQGDLEAATPGAS